MDKAWAATPRTFRRLLAWLDEGVDSGGQKYLEIRRRLVAYFDRRRCLRPDDLADDTLDRVARRLEEEGEISDAPPPRYCYIVARFVLLEYLRRPDSRRHDPAVELAQARDSDADDETQERSLDCLDRCLQQLAPDERALILGYYGGDRRRNLENRRELATQLGLSPNALTIRACRIRAKLEGCVQACRGGR